MRSWWTSKKKGYGRLCPNALGQEQVREHEQKSNAPGNRWKWAVPQIQQQYHFRIEFMHDYSKNVFSENSQIEQPILGVIESLSRVQSGHISEATRGENLVLSMLVETISHPHFSAALHCFLQISCGGLGSLLKPFKCLSELFRDFQIPHGKIQNTIARLHKRDAGA